MERKFRVVFLALTFIAALKAQVSTTSISGTVSDSSGAVVPAAEVIATNTATNLSRTAQTDTAGHYLIECLPIGDYQVDVVASGFKRFRQTGVVLDISRSARVDATLQIGG